MSQWKVRHHRDTLIVNRISANISFGRYGQVTMGEQNTYHKFYEPREIIDRTLYVTFRGTSSSLVINSPQLAYMRYQVGRNSRKCSKG
jgi:hypothetical protein